MGKSLYYLLKKNDKYGELLYSKAGFSWVLTTLQGGKAEFSDLFDKWGEERPTYRQWKMLYAVSKSRDYTLDDYCRVVADILDL